MCTQTSACLSPHQHGCSVSIYSNLPIPLVSLNHFHTATNTDHTNNSFTWRNHTHSHLFNTSTTNQPTNQPPHNTTPHNTSSHHITSHHTIRIAIINRGRSVSLHSVTPLNSLDHTHSLTHVIKSTTHLLLSDQTLTSTSECLL